MISVDIKTRFLPRDHKSFILFPGSGYRYYQYMRDTSYVFLDVPGFPLTPDEDILSINNYVERIVISQLIRAWHKDGKPDTRFVPRTVDDLTDYVETRARKQMAGLVSGFFKNIRPGDIVVVPARAQGDNVLFGEFQGSSIEQVAHPRYNGETVPARKVKWFKEIPRSNIQGWLDRRIPSPNPLRQIELDKVKHIYDLMYERYMYRDEFVCKFSVSSTEFSTVDGFLINQLILFVSAVHENRESDNPVNLALATLSSTVARLSDSIESPGQRIFINSPGHWVIFKDDIVPILFGVLLSMSAIVGASERIFSEEIRVFNSVEATPISSACEADIAEEVREDLQAIGYERWKEICEASEQARRRTGIDSGIDVAPTPPNRPPQRLRRQ